MMSKTVNTWGVVLQFWIVKTNLNLRNPQITTITLRDCYI